MGHLDVQLTSVVVIGQVWYDSHRQAELQRWGQTDIDRAIWQLSVRIGEIATVQEAVHVDVHVEEQLCRQICIC